MEIKKITCGIINNNNYILVKNNDCLIVDLSDFLAIDRYIQDTKLNVLGILLTHSHWDHLFGVEEFVRKYNVPVYLSSNRPNYFLDADFDYTIKKYGIRTKFNPKNMKLIYLDEGSHSVGNFNFVVIDTPGHTSCSVVYYFIDEKIMFTGDFLFRETIGITNTLLSNKKDMEGSLAKIKTFPGDVTIYPGHGRSTTLRHEKLYNQYFYKKFNS